MSRRIRASVALLIPVMLLGGAIACSVVPEEKIVKDFFRASRLRDNAALGAFATTYFDPNRDGQVVQLKVLTVSEEHTSPLPIKQYDTALDEATTAQKAFAREKGDFQRQNIETIARIEKLENNNAPVPRKDAAVHTAWSKWREDEHKHLKAVSDARVSLARVKAVAEVSLSQPNGPTPDVTHHVGDLVQKDVTVEAKVKMPDGQTVDKNLVVTLSRAIMKNEQGDQQTGRWIITNVKDAAAPQTS